VPFLKLETWPSYAWNWSYAQSFFTSKLRFLTGVFNKDPTVWLTRAGPPTPVSFHPLGESDPWTAQHTYPLKSFKVSIFMHNLATKMKHHILNSLKSLKSGHKCQVTGAQLYQYYPIICLQPCLTTFVDVFESENALVFNTFQCERFYSTGHKQIKRNLIDFLAI